MIARYLLGKTPLLPIDNEKSLKIDCYLQNNIML